MLSDFVRRTGGVNQIPGVLLFDVVVGSEVVSIVHSSFPIPPFRSLKSIGEITNRPCVILPSLIEKHREMDERSVASGRVEISLKRTKREESSKDQRASGMLLLFSLYLIVGRMIYSVGNRL